MQIFQCPSCEDRVYFDNLTCACGQQVFFDPDRQTMLSKATPCANRAEIDCNWVAAGDAGLCRACAMTETVPDLRRPDNLPLWAQTETAKRRMLASLGRWGWFAGTDSGPLPVFRLLSEESAGKTAPVVMGHADGLITINVTEADDAVRVERRAMLGELYRTMLGHMRHEIAHFLHQRLVAEDAGFAPAFRALFGDERADYGAALKRHYAEPKAPGETHITTYATAHPHEDWAETVAHLLHLVDIADSAGAVGLRMGDGTWLGTDAYAEADSERVLTRAVSLSLAVTHVNRALDLPDLYPFVLTPKVREKLAFAHGALRGAHGR